MSANGAHNEGIASSLQGLLRSCLLYTSSGKTAGEVSTDDIRTLNTELLSGNGADVLLLDGLPVDSYIEKGVLEDLTDLAADLTGQDSYLAEILKNTAQSGGKIYGMPLKFKIPILFGDEEVKACLLYTSRCV